MFHLQNSGYKLNFNTVMRTHKNIVLTALGEMADEENVKAYYAYLVISLRIRKYQVPFPDEDQVLEFDAARDEDVEGMLMGIIKLATEKKVQVDRGVIDITRRWVVQAWLSRNKKSQMVRKKWARDLMRRPC